MLALDEICNDGTVARLHRHTGILVLHRLHAHVSNIGQPAIRSTCNSLQMNGEIQILAVELDGHDGLVVTFSDGTTGGYVVEELLDLRPIRERVRTKNIKATHKASALKV